MGIFLLAVVSNFVVSLHLGVENWEGGFDVIHVTKAMYTRGRPTVWSAIYWVS